MRDLDGAPPSTTGAPRCQTIPEMRPVVLSGCTVSDSAWERRTLALFFSKLLFVHNHSHMKVGACDP